MVPYLVDDRMPQVGVFANSDTDTATVVASDLMQPTVGDKFGTQLPRTERCGMYGNSHGMMALATLSAMIAKAELDKQIARERGELSPDPPPQQPAPVQVLAGRNEPCPCGSGKKYKRCHGR